MASTRVLILLGLLAMAFGQGDVAVPSKTRAIDTVEGCVIDCTKGGYHQHPTDCKKFIQCAPSGPMVLSCPEETIWDQKNTVCNHDDSTTCETGSYLTPNGEACPEVPETTPAPPNKCYFKCPAKGGKFAHPRDCQKYFFCYFWIPVPVKCPFGLHFNANTNRCSIPLLARCEASSDAEC